MKEAEGDMENDTVTWWTEGLNSSCPSWAPR